jgi:hypothetical protein
MRQGLETAFDNPQARRHPALNGGRGVDGLMCINAGRAASSTMVFARQFGGTERDLDHAAFFA